MVRIPITPVERVLRAGRVETVDDHRQVADLGEDADDEGRHGDRAPRGGNALHDRIVSAINALPTSTTDTERVRSAIYLVVTSPPAAVQK